MNGSEGGTACVRGQCLQNHCQITNHWTQWLILAAEIACTLYSLTSASPSVTRRLPPEIQMLICQILFEHAWSFPTLYIFLSWHKYTIPWFFWSSRHFPHADSIFPQLPPAVRSSQLETSAWDHKQTSSFLPGVPSCLKTISQTDGVLEDQWQLYQIHVRAYGSSHPKKIWHQSTWLVNFYCRTIIPCTLLKFHSESSYLLPWYESPQ